MLEGGCIVWRRGRRDPPKEMQTKGKKGGFAGWGDGEMMRFIQYCTYIQGQGRRCGGRNNKKLEEENHARISCPSFLLSESGGSDEHMKSSLWIGIMYRNSDSIRPT